MPPLIASASRRICVPARHRINARRLASVSNKYGAPRAAWFGVQAMVASWASWQALIENIDRASA